MDYVYLERNLKKHYIYNYTTACCVKNIKIEAAVCRLLILFLGNCVCFQFVFDFKNNKKTFY